jgi:hypothetical protein
LLSPSSHLISPSSHLVDDCFVALKLLYDKVVKMLELNSGDHFQFPCNVLIEQLYHMTFKIIFSRKKKFEYCDKIFVLLFCELICFRWNIKLGLLKSGNSLSHCHLVPLLKLLGCHF